MFFWRKAHCCEPIERSNLRALVKPFLFSPSSFIMYNNCFCNNEKCNVQVCWYVYSLQCAYEVMIFCWLDPYSGSVFCFYCNVNLYSRFLDMTSKECISLRSQYFISYWHFQLITQILDQYFNTISRKRSWIDWHECWSHSGQQVTFLNRSRGLFLFSSEDGMCGLNWWQSLILRTALTRIFF